MDDIKCCPHCGGKCTAKIGNQCIWIECQVCGCRTKEMYIGSCYLTVDLMDGLNQVIDIWNKRR